jgi:uncharacterized protein YbjT (DUF2867 family)
MAAKTIAIVGATGTQGGGLARAILEDRSSEFAVRALTRNPDSEKARALRDLGAEVVAADLDDINTLLKAFEGAYGAFCVTNFWEYLSPEREISQAERMADAAKRAGLEHVIWSTLEDSRDHVKLDDDRMPTLMGRYKVPHYDGKGEADKLFTERGLPVTLYRTSFYWDNMIHFGLGPKQQPDGRVTLSLPLGDARLPGMAAVDIGRCAYGVLKRSSDFIGKTIGVAGGFLTGAEMAAGLSKALGREVLYDDLSPEAFRNLGFPGADDLGNMFHWQRDFADAYCGNRSLELSRELNPELQSYDVWLEHHRHELTIG